MAHRIFNFNAGPSTLPLDVLKTVQDEFLDYRGTGMSIVEISHRSPEFEEINETAIKLFRQIAGLPDNYHVIFLGGGASTQFAMIPMNFLPAEGTAAYVDTGLWSSKAIKEAKMVGNVHLAGSSKEDKYSYIPPVADITVPKDVAYLHLSSNNTIFGTQYHEWPDAGDVPLVCDMSSDIFSRKLDFSKFSLIYAGAQKNLGPAGVTVVAIRDDMLARCKDGVPTMLDYRTHTKGKSLYNTPPAFGIYMVKLVMEWLIGNGGLDAVEKTNFAKKERIYQMIDLHSDYFKGTVEPKSRSWMNITFRLPSEELEKKLIAEAKSAGFGGLKGHRSVGGIRVSCYNAMSLEGVEKLVELMELFKNNNPA